MSEIRRTSQVEKSLARALRKNNLIYDQSLQSLLAYDEIFGYFELLTLDSIVNKNALFFFHKPMKNIEVSEYVTLQDSLRFKSLLEEIYSAPIERIRFFEDQRDLFRYRLELENESELEGTVDELIEEVIKNGLR